MVLVLEIVYSSLQAKGFSSLCLTYTEWVNTRMHLNWLHPMETIV